MQEKVLVTGAAGFIGSHLTEELVRANCIVHALVHYNFKNNWGWLEYLPNEILNEINIIQSDITDPYAVSKAVKGIDIVYHLAALIAIPYSYEAPASYVSTNISGTLNILQACLDNGINRVIHTSTSEAYGTAQYTPIDENHPLVGQSPYSATKIAADKLAESYYCSFGLPVVTIRPFNTFGPRQSARAIIPTIITQAISDKQEINVGSLSPIRDLSYVKDTVKAFIDAKGCEIAIGQVINIGRGNSISIGQLASLILKICNSNAKIVTKDERLRPERSEVMELICDNSKAKELLGWEPQYSLQQGLEKTVEWFKLNRGIYKENLYNI